MKNLGKQFEQIYILYEKKRGNDMKKKITTFLLISGIAIVICSCGNQSVEVEEGTDNVNSKETIKTEGIDKTNVTEEEEILKESELKDEVNVTEEVDSLEEINTSIEERVSILEDTIKNEEVLQLIISTEQEVAILENSIKNDMLTQIEYNEKTKQLYELWDFALNKIWGILKETLEEEDMSQLTIEEREWIAFKEQEVAKAGVGYEGGSMQPMIMNQKAAEMTKERVYELIELLK